MGSKTIRALTPALVIVGLFGAGSDLAQAGPKASARPIEIQPRAKRCVDQTAAVEPTSAGGFTLRKKAVGLGLELGFPFLDFHLAVGVTPRFQLEVGYRGLYLLTHAGYAAFKASIYEGQERRSAVAIRGVLGYTASSQPYFEGEAARTMIGGGDGVFAELWVLSTWLRRRHGLLLAVGLRFAYVRACRESPHTQYSSDCLESLFSPLGGESGFQITLSVDLGWEHRLATNLGFFIALGLDVPTRRPDPLKNFPVWPRLRCGITFEILSAVR